MGLRTLVTRSGPGQPPGRRLARRGRPTGDGWDHRRAAVDRVGPVPEPAPRPGRPRRHEPPLAPGRAAPVARCPRRTATPPLVNGVAYPYLEVRPPRVPVPDPQRLRWTAPQPPALPGPLGRADVAGDGSLADAGRRRGADGARRAGGRTGRRTGRPTDATAGCPTRRAAGPELIQIGNECGLLPAPVVLPNRPVGYRYDRLDPTVLNVDGHALLLAPGERADVVVDFSTVPPGSTLILYNDCPAPLPGFDPRYDQHTDAPDRTAEGGPPPTQPGYGPNTRTLLQFRVTGAPAPPYDLDRLRRPAAPARTRPASARRSCRNRRTTRRSAPAPPGGDAVPAHATSVTFTPAGGAGPVTLPIAGEGRRAGLRAGSRPAGRSARRRPPARRSARPRRPCRSARPTRPPRCCSPPTRPYRSGAPTDGTQLWRISGDRPADPAAALRRLRRAAGQPGRLGRHGPPPGRRRAGLEGDRPGQPPARTWWWRCARSRPPLPFKLGDSVRLLDPTRPPGVRTGVDPGQPGRRAARRGGQPDWSTWAGSTAGTVARRPPRPGHEPAAGAAGLAPGADRADRHPGARLGHRAAGHRADLDRQRQTAAGHQPPAATGHRRDFGAGRHHDHRRGRRHPLHRRHGHPGRHLPLPDPGRERGQLLVLVEQRARRRCACAAPSGLVAAMPPAAPLRVALRWTNRSFATGIDVQRATNPTFTSGPGTTADRGRRQPPGHRRSPRTPRTTTGSGPRTWVRRRPWSTVATVTTPPVPGAPTGVAATASAPRRTPPRWSLSWAASTPAGPGAGFIVQRALDPAFGRELADFTVTGRGFTNTGLARGVTYHYRVRVVQRRGQLAVHRPDPGHHRRRDRGRRRSAGGCAQRGRRRPRSSARAAATPCSRSVASVSRAAAGWARPPGRASSAT